MFQSHNRIELEHLCCIFSTRNFPALHNEWQQIEESINCWIRKFTFLCFLIHKFWQRTWEFQFYPFFIFIFFGQKKMPGNCEHAVLLASSSLLLILHILLTHMWDTIILNWRMLICRWWWVPDLPLLKTMISVGLDWRRALKLVHGADWGDLSWLWLGMQPVTRMLQERKQKVENEGPLWKS